MKLFYLAIILTLSDSAQADILLGTARDDSGKIIYLEQHQVFRDEQGFNKLIKVEYRRPNGSVFARMSSDFSKNRLIPETTFEDDRFGIKQTIRLNEKNVEFETFKSGISREKKSYSLKGIQVASQGFDNFIRTYSNQLSSDAQQFHFGVLSELDFFSLVGYKRASKEDGLLEYGIRSSSWFIRMFIDELRITYDSKSLRLKSFSGRSNILNDQERPQKVSIDYEWKEEQ